MLRLIGSVGGYLTSFQMRMEQTLKRSVISLGVTGLLLMGAGFFSVAGWLVLSQLAGSVVACLVVGVVLIIAACVVYYVMLRERVVAAATGDPVAAAALETESPIAGVGTTPHTIVTPTASIAGMAPVLAQAFLTGMTIGLAGKRKD